jgi:hypothetical protein
VKKSARNPRGRTHQVLYRRGGRLHRIESAGTFKTQTEARARATSSPAGSPPGSTRRPSSRNSPQVEAAETKTPVQWRDDWLTSRHDLAAKSERLYRNGTDAILAILDTDDLLAVTAADCLRAAGALATMKSKRGRPYAPATIANYWQAFEQLLEYAGVDPNPARDKRIRLPKAKRTPPTVPTAEHVTVMLQKIASKYVLPMVTIEQTAMRVESIETLAWAYVDVRGTGPAGREGRQDPVGRDPALADAAARATCPLEDRLPEPAAVPAITTQRFARSDGDRVQASGRSRTTTRTTSATAARRSGTCSTSPTPSSPSGSATSARRSRRTSTSTSCPSRRSPRSGSKRSSKRPARDKSERRFWKLYREERAKFGSFKEILTPQQIVRAAREARRRLDEAPR